MSTDNQANLLTIDQNEVKSKWDYFLEAPPKNMSLKMANVS
jgi:hypothetical protein